mgnify:CR=1 FL=1
MKIISVIPARGGSKSIKNKNLIKLNNKPLIYYAIKQSQKSKFIKRSIVSTNDKKIAKIAKKYGAEVPFLRPNSISKNNSKDFGFFLHLINWLKKNENYSPDLIVQLRPTQPYRDVKFIDKAIQIMMRDKKADSLRSISVPERTPYKMWKIKGNYLDYIFPNTKFQKKEYFNLDRRKLQDIYWHDGVIDIVKTKTIKKYNNLTGKKIAYIKNNKEFLVDIDSKKDLKLAKIFIKKKFIKLNDN